MTTAIIAAGSIGSVPAANLARGREDVVLASRSPGHAQAGADHVGARAAIAGDAIGTADIVIFAMWFDVAKELLARYRGALSRKKIVAPPTPSLPTATAGSRRPSQQAIGRTNTGRAGAFGCRFVQPFGTQTAHTLASSIGQQPPTAQFYAVGDQAASAAISRADHDSTLVLPAVKATEQREAPVQRNITRDYGPLMAQPETALSHSSWTI